MKWRWEEIGATAIECKECMSSWPRKQSLRVLLLLEAFSQGKVHSFVSSVEVRLKGRVVRKEESSNRTGGRDKRMGGSCSG